MKKLLAIHYRPPLKNGRSNSFGQYCIHQTFNKMFDVKGLCFGVEGEELDRFKLIKLSSTNYEKIFKFLFQLQSVRLTHYHCREFKRTLIEQILSFNPELIYVEHIVMMQYLVDIETKAKVILYDDDSSIYASKMKLKQSLLQRVRNYGLSQFEATAIQRADYILTITNEEKELLKNFSNKNFFTIPYGIDTKHFAYQWSAPLDKSLLFVGNFDHYPNRLAIKYIMKNIYPLLNKYNCKLRIVGRNTKRIQKFCNSAVEIKDNVPDVREYYYSSSALIAPIFSGAGQRIKIMEAAACGTPVITTKLGNLGFNFSTEEAFIIDNVQGVEEALLELFTSDRAILYQRTMQARKKIEDEFSKQNIQRVIDKLIKTHLK